jgi:aerobic-type carbon monoxide dehydrogenase small subunit (CoxS/CutS family)
MNGVFQIQGERKMEETIKFTLNGKSVSITTDNQRPLLWVLRTDFGLTGTKYGCGQAICGACIVLVDNGAVRSCVYPIRNAEGREVVTIEGLSNNGTLHPIQEAFVKHNALQCGFCTPGMIMMAYSLLYQNPDPTREEIIQGMNENLCRCGAHTRIIDAIQSAAEQMKGGNSI